MRIRLQRLATMRLDAHAPQRGILNLAWGSAPGIRGHMLGTLKAYFNRLGQGRVKYAFSVRPRLLTKPGALPQARVRMPLWGDRQDASTVEHSGVDCPVHGGSSCRFMMAGPQ